LFLGFNQVTRKGSIVLLGSFFKLVQLPQEVIVA